MRHQEALTVFAKLKPGGADAVRGVLAKIDQDVEANEMLPFASLRGVHFARFVVLDEAQDIHGRTITPSLVYAANVDAPIRDHLAQLMAYAPALDQIFVHCEGYPGAAERTEQARLAFLRTHAIPSQAFYVNTVGRPVQQVRDEIRLRDEIQNFLDREAESLKGRPAADIRKAVREFCRSDPNLRWALEPAPRVPLWWRVRERLRFYSILGGLLLLSPALLVVTPAWLLALRRLEKRDARAPTLRLSRQPRGDLAILEDQVVQNQFSAVGNVKPERLRYLTLRVLLTAANIASRHYFNRGDLGSVRLLGLHGVNTIHFAQWIVIDEGRRVLFLSNYDGSLTSYMDDFINKVAWGLNGVFSNGQYYPRTRWLVLDGANDEQSFKAFLQKHQIPTQVWYTAYKDSTALNVSNNARIRAGLGADTDGRAAEEWTQLL